MFIYVVAVLAICQPCICLVNVWHLRNHVYKFGHLHVSFDRQRGNGTGSVYYDVTETDTLDHKITHLTAKVCTEAGPHLEHEERTIDSLWKKAGATVSAMIAHNLPFYYCEGFVGDYSVLFSPKVEMTLEEKLRIPVLPDNLLAHQKEMLLIMLQILKAVELFHDQGIVLVQLRAQDIVIRPNVHVGTDLTLCQRYPKVSDNGRTYVDLTVIPDTASSLVPDKQYHKPDGDWKQMAIIMDHVFPHGVVECNSNGDAFPYYFIEDANRLTEYDYGPSLLESSIVSCMRDLEMKIPRNLKLHSVIPDSFRY